LKLSQTHERILIYGVTGSGKTTLAQRLGDVTGLPWHSVDDLTWEANWTPVSNELQTQKIESICGENRWILDTAYGTWIHVPLQRAQLIVALDYPRWISLGRLLRRTVSRALDGRPICNGNRETFRLTFNRNSILVWHFKSFARKRTRILKWAAESEGPEVVHIRTPKQLEEWINSYPTATGLPSATER
jgi:adenylate kinase family enzyme